MKLNARPSEVDFTQLEEQLAHGRRAGVDFVIAQLHWGMEYELYPRPEQVELAHHLADLGVDAIVGHHPHVLQPVEHYRTRRDPDRVVPVFYSLGNLTNPFSAPYLCRSGVARIELARGTAGGRKRAHLREGGDALRGRPGRGPRQPEARAPAGLKNGGQGVEGRTSSRLCLRDDPR